MSTFAAEYRYTFLYAGFAALLGAFVLVAATSYFQFNSASRELGRVTAANEEKLQAALTMRLAVRERAIILWHMTQIDDPFDRDERYQQFTDFGARFLGAREALRRFEHTAEEDGLLSRIDQETVSRASVLREFADLLLREEKVAESVNYLDKVLTEQVVVAQLLDELIRLQHRYSDQAREVMAERSNVIVLRTAAIVFVIIVLGAYFARRVVREAHGQADELARANDELAHLARKDALTGLPNRLYMNEHMALAVAHAQRYGETGAVLFIDLDGFKLVNDRFGHEAGDRYLKSAAAAMRAQLREADLLIRLGGDEFVVVLQQVPDREDVEIVAQKLLDALGSDHEVGVGRVRGSGSIGVCFFPVENWTVDDLLRCADAAMYSAKEDGKNCYRVSGESLAAF